ncbi:MAG TPA: hypothetical protein PKC24_06775, partial [Cyclobacteriaceae bacterium]|nr:hypothetical protein [Cyclobacteriaceae bacterium]
MKRIISSLFLCLLMFGLQAHIGSPGVIFEGKLGKYQIMANVEPPEVIPGTAKITVVIQGNPENVKVFGKPVY